ncbi:outer membrane beta-barrel protein [Sphingomonas cannabina]|uniref:outer membrane beta-barrel protein n=1 Tax=Sphingomonas cannabina TaxID=2899123 RepID=UPI001F179A41|nr:outer membrane beta-barrel protein [Sphingomonas cannabina]UIJ43997.1 outer membrane beta-barrel protein [Sphingomonas cannabina]
MIASSSLFRPLPRWLLASTILCGTCSPAFAQEAQLPRLANIETVTVEDGVDLDVRERHRPELDPVGHALGAWRIYPSATLSAGWDSNLFGSEDDRVSAGFLQLEPAVAAVLSSSQLDVTLDASGRFARFADQPHAKENAYRLAGFARRELSSLSSIEGGVDFEQLVERRESSEFPGGRVAPSIFLRTRLYTTFRYQTGKFGGLATVDYTTFNYRDTDALAADGTVVGRIDQDVRDQHTLRGSLRGEFEVTPAIGLFVQGIGSSIDYRKDEVAPGVPNPGGSEYTLLGGVAFRPSSLFVGSIGAGYVWRSYDAVSLRSINGFALNADVRYYLTPLVTISAQAARTVEEAVLQSARGYVSDSASVRADYELLRSLLINVRASYQHNDFRSSPRLDRIVDVGAGARYQANRALALDVDASYVNRDVKGDPFAASFDEFRVRAGVRYSF